MVHPARGPQHLLGHRQRAYPSGTAHDLGTLPGDNDSRVLGLSASGKAAGQSARYDYTEHAATAPTYAFVWSGAGPLVHLPLPNLPAALSESKAPDGSTRIVLSAAGYAFYLKPGPPPVGTVVANLEHHSDPDS